MNSKDRIDRINKMATAPEEHRANWKPLAESIAAEVEAEIAKLRTFAGLKPDTVADTCDTTADLLETELKAAVAKFDCSESTKKCFYCDGEITQAQLDSADACGLGRGRYAHIDCIAQDTATIAKFDCDKGYDQGYEDGYGDAHADSHGEQPGKPPLANRTGKGYDQGYEDGYRDARADSHGEQ